MRKSVSLNNITPLDSCDVSEKNVNSCQQYLNKNTEVTNEATNDKQEDMENVNQNQDSAEIDSRITEHESKSKLENAGSNEVHNYSASYDTLPCRGSHNKSNITRSIVPKMRKMFEKARSCEPDLNHTKVTEQTSLRHRSALAFDGTESARSSFVILSSRGATRSNTNSTATLSETTEDSEQLKKSKGFVNKCVTKMKSFIGKSQERD